MSTPPRKKKPRRLGAPGLIRLRGVRTHNLRGIDVDIPRNQLTVVTGVSGSGKSSLAFDTLYAEGRRRYVECLSTYLQQFMERIPRPELDHVDTLPPAVAMQRAVPATQARSTVGTTTEISDYFRVLYARVGKPHCTGCGREVRVDHPEDVAAALAEHGGRAFVTFEPARGSGETPPEALARLARDGFSRVWFEGRFRGIEEVDAGRRGIEGVADRLVLEASRRARIAEAVELAYRYGSDRCAVRFESGGTRRYSRRRHCPDCDRDFPDPEPNLFSPNSALGACPACQGFGREIAPDLDRVVPDRSKTLAEGAVDPWNKPSYREAYTDLARAGQAVGLPWDVPYASLAPEHRDLIEQGGEGFYGIVGFFKWLERKTYKLHVRVFLSRYRKYTPCATCGGARLRPEARAVTLAGRAIDAVSTTPVADLLAWVRSLDLTTSERAIAASALREIDGRLRFLDEVGLGYLELERPTRTLSGGEAQRIQVARSLGSGLVDTLYVLDEPSVGLHPRDVDRLIRVLERLRDLGNTIVVVEHDPRVMRAADWIVDLGPGAGVAGGGVVYQGPARGIGRCPDSTTARFLTARPTASSRTDAVGLGVRARAAGAHDAPEPGWIGLSGASLHNLRGDAARFPRRALTVVTGVSGSGKSSLIHDTLYGALRTRVTGAHHDTGPFEALEGVEGIAAVELVDQSPIGRSPRSNPVTYVKAFDGIRKRLAGTPEARARGLSPGHFSFNVAGGRCDACEGTGAVVVEMHFLADLLLPCEACGGKRFGPSALEVRYRGANVAEILDLTITEARERFDDVPETARRLAVLEEIGLGYLRLGQPAPTLSGGEAQRLKLAAHLGARSRGECVFLLDEPTTGLHPADVAVLVSVIDRLIGSGHTVVVVEHHLDLIRSADWILDLGPGSGRDGGRIVAQGSPAEVAMTRTETGRYLAEHLGV